MTSKQPNRCYSCGSKDNLHQIASSNLGICERCFWSSERYCGPLIRLIEQDHTSIAALRKIRDTQKNLIADMGAKLEELEAYLRDYHDGEFAEGDANLVEWLQQIDRGVLEDFRAYQSEIERLTRDLRKERKR